MCRRCAPLVMRCVRFEGERRRDEQGDDHRAVACGRRSQEVAILGVARTVGRHVVAWARKRAAGLDRSGGHREDNHRGQKDAETPHSQMIPRTADQSAAVSANHRARMGTVPESHLRPRCRSFRVRPEESHGEASVAPKLRARHSRQKADVGSSKGSLGATVKGGSQARTRGRTDWGVLRRTSAHSIAWGR